MFRPLICLVIIICLFYISFLLNIEFFSLTNKNYMDYRLGDFLKGYIFRKEKYIQDNIIKNYPDSLCSKYYKIVKNYNEEKMWNNIEVISKLINDVETEVPDRNTLVIHLRIGDAIIDYKNGKFIYRKTGFNNSTYGTPLEKIDKFILENKNKFKNVVLVYGIHKGHTHDISLSEKYLDELRSILFKHNIKFNERHNDNPDLDFCYMCKSKHFIRSGSGFSSLVSSVVEYKNNKVYKL